MRCTLQTKNSSIIAEVIVDRFHIVEYLNSASNNFRIQEMKELKTDGHEAILHLYQDV
ncbi:transposase [Enterococcus sp. BWT-B8]|uniref:transposase n=1 Tax=Enterococcus sp. BWT-B8 TaxID=2885157 RepID=UPI002A0D8BDA|nr:transposase [Enterococcus sp. BWT-B8]